MEIRKDIAYGEEPEQLLDIYPAERADKTLVFFHGGGLEGCTKEENADAFAVLAQNGISVVSVEYRMYRGPVIRILLRMARGRWLGCRNMRQNRA